jgi:multiple sugar transport system ATP-binding protein
MAEVKLIQVNKFFDSVVAVKDANLNIPDGEFCVILGPSGCGKTTTLRLIAGLEKATSGEIFIGERLVNDLPPKERDIAMVFQSYALYPHMSVFDNMAFGLKMARVPRKEISNRVREAAMMLEIQDLLKRKPRALSGGQRQRVALGRAIVRQPKVYLMDEPLSNLDAKLRVQTRVELTKLHLRLGVTTIYVTHDQVEAMTLGQMIVIMNKGEIQQVGNPNDIYCHPANLFVAGFIGSPPMNFFPAKVVKEEGKLILDCLFFQVKVTPDHLQLLQPFEGKEVVLGFRPEDIWEGEFKEEGRETVQAKVDVVEHLGSESYLYITTEKEGNATSFIARVDPSTKGRVGQPITLSFNMVKSHVFDNESEKAIF